MKFLQFFTTIFLFFIISPSIFSQYIPNLPHPIEDVEQPRSLLSLHRQLDPTKFVNPQNDSIIEENPSEYSLQSPLTISQEELLFPQKIKANSPEAYNQNGINFTTPLKEFNPAPGTQGIVLVRNMSALRLLPGYYGLAEKESLKTDDKLPKYSKDPHPYYSPITNSSEIILGLNKNDHIFSVPIELSEEKDPFDPENEELHEHLKQRLLRNPQNSYYDPTYFPYWKKLDNLNQTLVEASYRKLKPKAERLEDYMKNRRQEEREKNLILGKRELIDEYKIDHQKNWALMRENEDDLFQDWYNKTEGNLYTYPIKKNDPKPYRLGFKEIDNNEKKNRKLTKKQQTLL